MDILACRSLRDSLLAYLGSEVEVSTFEENCVLTLPLKTIDDRFLDVYVDSKLGDYLIVHDGGRASAELFAQGIHLTEKREAQLRAIGGRYGIAYEDGAFTVGCRANSLQQSILAVAQCASLAMVDVLTHTPVVEAEHVSMLVKRTLERWKPDDVDLRHRLHVKGHTPGTDHVFDSVAFPRGKRAVAVNALAPGYGPMIQAARYGFMTLDIRGTEYDKWQRLAVVAKAEQWPAAALMQVRSLASKTIEARSGEEQHIEQELPRVVEELAA